MRLVKLILSFSGVRYEVYVLLSPHLVVRPDHSFRAIKSLEIFGPSLTDALGDIDGGVTSRGEAEGEGGVDFEPEAGVIPVLHQDAHALEALLQDLAKPRAAVRGRRLGVIPTNIGEARCEPEQLIHALGPVLSQV